MNRDHSYINRFIKKFKYKFYNHKGDFEIQKVIEYVFSYQILNIPKRIRNKIIFIYFTNKKTPAQINQVDVTLLPKIDRLKSYTFTQSATPVVSIIIPIYNQIHYTQNCILSLHENIRSKYTFELIIIDDNSSDDSCNILADTFKGITIIRNDSNLGFLRSCNKGASVAKGKYICFLNNDTFIQPNWMESLVDTIQSNESVGLVGSMLIYPNGVLQEAGGIIWSDSSGWNYGRNENRFSPSYNYVREVDYISGASILLRKSDFDLLNGFDELFAPAYYEDTDLCFSIRHRLNKKVMYCPSSRVVHFEGITSGTDLNAGAKKYQVVNKEKFSTKWEAELKHYINPNDSNFLFKGISKYNQKHILIVDSYVPFHDKESGSNRLFQIIKLIHQLGYKITFLPDNEKDEQPYTKELQEIGVEVLYRNINFHQQVIAQLNERLATIDVAWICRPELFSKYHPLLSVNPSIKFIYDTIDLHFLRLKRENELFPNKKNDWESIKQMELQSASKADLTLAITPTDETVLKNLGVENVSIIPNIHYLKYAPENDVSEFEKRTGLLFIGGYSHTPNIDAVIWLIKDIMPHVWKVIPTMHVTLLGSNPTKDVLNLKSDKVDVPGFIADVSSYFHTHKVFVAPLRYGSGMKGKIGQSIEYGLPIVSTEIGVEGMNMHHEQHALIAASEIEIAENIIKLYGDQNLWTNIRNGGTQIIEPYAPIVIQQKIKTLLEEL